LPVQPGVAVPVGDAPFCEQLRCLRVDLMFYGLNSRHQCVCRVIRSDGDTARQDSRAAIQFVGDEVNRAAVMRIAGFKYAVVRVESWVQRQQRRMDVEYFSVEMSYEPRAQDAHESGQNDERGLESIEFLRDGSIKGFAIRELSMFDAGRLYTGILCARKAIGVTSVGHDDSNFEIDTIVGDLVDEGLQVTAGTGDQDSSFQK